MPGNWLRQPNVPTDDDDDDEICVQCIPLNTTKYDAIKYGFDEWNDWRFD